MSEYSKGVLQGANPSRGLAEQARQEPEVPRSLQALGSHIERLKDAVSELEQRLIPVRDTPPPSPESATKDTPVRTQLANAIHVQTMEVVQLYGRIRLILDTLEL